MSAYTFTKSVAAGAYLVPLLLGALGLLPLASSLWGLQVPVIAMVGLLLTGALLVWDLEHPERFWMVLFKPQWRSWLVRGGFIITGYGGLLAAHVGLTVVGRADLTTHLAWIGAPLAVMTAIYTAYLFGQSRARDLWQSPLLPTHLLVQALVAGSAVLVLTAGAGGVAVSLMAFLRIALLAHVLLVLGEVSMKHPTAHAALAARIMTRGAYGHLFWIGLALATLGIVAAPWSPPIAAGAALGGLLLYEHAFVQAGQAVPLA